MTFAAIADLDGRAVAHADVALEGQRLPAGENLASVLSLSAVSQTRAIYSGQGRNLEFRQPLLTWQIPSSDRSGSASRRS